MLRDDACILTWKARRAATGYAAKVGLPIAIGSFAVFAACVAGAAQAGDVLPLLIGAFLAFFIVLLSMGFVLRAVYRHYRCPRCDQVPMSGGFQAGLSSFGYRRGLMLFPKTCPRCNAPFA